MKKLLLSSLLICFSLINNVLAQPGASQTVLPASYRMAAGYDIEVYQNEQYIVLENGSIGVSGALYKNDGIDITEITLPGSLRMAEDHTMEVYGSELYSVLEDGFSGIRGALHKYDGTSFTQINLPGSLEVARDYDMEVYNNDLYLVLEDGFSGIRGALHKYDGTTFTQINLPGSLEMAEGYNMIMYDNDLYVVLEDGFSGIRGALHKYDGTTFTQINLPGSLEMARNQDLEVYGNNLHLVLEDGFSGIRGAFHKYDGSTFKQINLPGTLKMAQDYNLGVFNCKLYFVLEDGFSGINGALYELDNISPTVVSKDITVELDANGEATITAAEVDNGSADNCGVGTLALDVTSFDCSNLGENTVTLTVTDASGNEASATATVTVVDNIVPIVITQDITVDLAGQESAAITPGQVNNGSTDNCTAAGDLIFSLSQDTFTEAGTYSISLTAEDASGNFASANLTVTVTDSTLSTDEFNSTVSVNFYPNPAQQLLNIEANRVEIGKVIVFTITGSKALEGYGSKLNVSTLSSGVYLAKIESREGKPLKVIKFIKK